MRYSIWYEQATPNEFGYYRRDCIATEDDNGVPTYLAWDTVEQAEEVLLALQRSGIIRRRAWIIRNHDGWIGGTVKEFDPAVAAAA